MRTFLVALSILLAGSVAHGENTKIKNRGDYLNGAIQVDDGSEHGAMQYFQAGSESLTSTAANKIGFTFLEITTVGTGTFNVIVETAAAPNGSTVTMKLPGGITYALRGVEMSGVQVSVIPSGGSVFLVAKS